MAPFNVALKESRLELGLSVKQLAERTAFTPGFVASYEDYAVNPTVRTIFNFARALSWTVTIDRKGVRIEDRNGAVVLQDWDPNDQRAG